MDDYDRGGHTKYSLLVHLIFVTKYRKPLFRGKMDDDVKQYLFEAAQTVGVRIVKMETDRDHVHILLRYRPDMSISHIAGQLKQRSTHELWRAHARTLQRSYWKRQALWSDGYFACSIGQVSQKIIEQYIQNQG